MTPLKMYREWFSALSPEWAAEISKYVIHEALSLPLHFVRSNQHHADIVDAAIDDIDDFQVYLIDILNHTVDRGFLDYERLVCQQLLISTTYALIVHSAENVEINNMLQDTQMENLVLNDLQKAEFYKEKLNESIQSQSEAKELKRQWDEFTAKYFNMELFYQREYNSLTF